MKTLTVFYDPHCGLCAKFRRWLLSQPRRVAVDFVPYDSPAAIVQFPDLPDLGADRDVVVMADDGRWWQGTAAWLTCLWATEHYSDWSFRLASPALQPMVKKAVHLLSENRLALSRLLALPEDNQLHSALKAVHVDEHAGCAGGNCHT